MAWVSCSFPADLLEFDGCLSGQDSAFASAGSGDGSMAHTIHRGNQRTLFA